MSARSKSRKRALDIVYGADVRGVSIADLLVEESRRAETQPQRSSSWGYARDLARGVADNLAEIDAVIAAHAQGWSLERMPALDRALARLATWEILFNDEVPDAVAIAEAVDLAKSLSTDESGPFLNGLLGAIVRERGSARDAR